MRTIDHLQGAKELENIKKYAPNLLSAEEWAFIKVINEKAEDFINYRSDKFLGFGEVIELEHIWRKFQYLKPFLFLFDPRKSMPEIIGSQAAFIIWTVWRSNHLLGPEDLKGATLASAKILSEYQPPYSLETKDKAIGIFITTMMISGGGNYSQSGSFWHNKIFPYLEGVWEFRWELKY